ncbi:aminotransferase [Weissella beninensis]|uniref:Aminotransferase n=1 Tax=Periweissella beninensis TaxID=504936 RepID=A0ABT0VIT0_9LACO|nr:aminotransferase class I/II-fold pyridoxal phosphate-dependent enzyme [Periweissella beninensis]MBM7544492.1 aminotransferase [Periweissella beninensis]MCM2437033.1 aminotransferase class I/II-fold pyridoxal phosphate-dependent enzyme [Periweissella beninensis]
MPNTKTALLKQLNTNLTKIEPSEIRAFDNEVSQIKDIVKLTLGEPDFAVPTVVKQAAITSIEADDSHYAPGNGTVALRQAASDFLADRYQLNYAANNEIVITIGATEAIYATIATVLNPGDEIIIPTPIFPFYEAITNMLGGQPVLIDTSATEFKLTKAALTQVIAEHPHAKAIVLNYPSNPTGVTYSAAELQQLATVLATTDLVVIADEIYSELVYDGQHASIAQFLPEQTLLLNGVSKSHAMTGYRIGFIAGPAALMQRVGMVHQMTVTAPSNPAMAAAVVALGTPAGKDATLAMKTAYQQRRDFIVTALTELNFTVAKPNGAFYVFAKLPTNLEQDDRKFARSLAYDGLVAVVPGAAFGLGGAGYIRISYANSLANLELAMQRLANYLKQLGA